MDKAAEIQLLIRLQKLQRENVSLELQVGELEMENEELTEYLGKALSMIETTRLQAAEAIKGIRLKPG